MSSSAVDQEQREIVIALAGNPNSGKTSVFNELTGAHQHVGNWPGVTVEHKEGTVRRNGRTFRVVDLPGIYSLSAYSEEEVIARDFLIRNDVDVVVNVVDASNLERNLYLTTQLLELGIGTIVALNMVDMAERMGQTVDVERFARLLGVEVVPTVASRGRGVEEILDRAVEVAACSTCDPPRSARHNAEIEHELAKLQASIPLRGDCTLPQRWLLVKSLEGDAEAAKLLDRYAATDRPPMAEVERTREHLEQVFRNDIEAVIADGRYGFIGGLLREVVSRSGAAPKANLTDRLDAILLHRVLGAPIFLALMWLTFKLTFDVGSHFVDLIDGGISALSSWASAVLPAGPVASLVVDGMIAGVGGVVVFVPNILIIFVIISFLEDSGYMARAAFLMDRAMHALGLHGKSFIPMLMGFGCNVPAVMATRTLETKEDRLLTILINPLMSCTARLPIYILFTGVFFSERGAWVIFSIYGMGIVLAVASGKLFRKLLFPKSVSPFVMELPPYRLPTLKGTVIHVWERTSLFLSKAGTVILAASVVIWALGSLPWGKDFGSTGTLVWYVGQALEPIVRPLGMDWRAGVALFFGLGAKEIVVSTLGVLYGFGHHDEGGDGLQGAIAAAFSPLSAYVFMAISLIYVPCVATIAAIRRETNSWGWTALSVGYSMLLAYAVGFAIYRIGLMVISR